MRQIEMKIRNYQLWNWEWVVILIVLIFLLFKIFPGLKDWATGTEKVKVDNSAALKVDSIKRVNNYNDSIKTALANAKATNKQYADLTAKQQRAYDSLMANCNKPVPRRVTKYIPKFIPKPVAMTPQKVIIEIQDKRTPQATVQFNTPTTPVTIKVNTASNTDATYLSNETGNVGKTVILEDKPMKFCIRLHTKNGFKWWPYEAVYTRGKKFAELTDNGIGGVDLGLRPSGTFATIVPVNYFVTTDGYCGVVESQLTSEELKNDADFFNLYGAWVPWQRQNVNGVWCRVAIYAPDYKN